MKTKKFPYWVQKIANLYVLNNDTETNNVIINEITFKSNGMKLRRKGYEITIINRLKNVSGHETRLQITFEPKSYNDSSGLKWFVYGNIVSYITKYGHNSIHVKRISEIYKLMK